MQDINDDTWRRIWAGGAVIAAFGLLFMGGVRIWANIGQDVREFVGNMFNQVCLPIAIYLILPVALLLVAGSLWPENKEKESDDQL